MRDIAFYGNFSLRYKTYFCEHTYTTHDIEIVKWGTDKRGKKYCYSIASWIDHDEPDLVSCGHRLIEEIDNMEDLEAIKKLVDIGTAILATKETVIELKE